MILEQTTFTIVSEHQAFLNAASELEATFLSKQPGFISRILSHIPSTKDYVDCVKWENLELAHVAMQKAMTDTSPKVGTFMQCIDMESVKVEYFDQIKE